MVDWKHMKAETYLLVTMVLITGCQANLRPENMIERDAEVLCYSPCVASLSGILTKESVFGPPNFGETPEKDRKLTISF